MLKAMLGTLVFALSLSSHVYAADENSSESKTSVKIDDAAGRRNSVAGDIDEEITNAKLRAESGSKSKFSMSVEATYTGGSVSRPFGENRPDIKGIPGAQKSTSANIGVNARYRMNKNDSITAGTSFGVMTPFQGRVNSKRKQFNVFDPNVAYNRVGKVGDLQTTGLLQYSPGTSNEARDADRTHAVSAQYVAMKAFQNGISIGAAFEADYYVYSTGAGKSKNADNSLLTGMYGNDGRAQWELGIFPLAEYAINDRYSLRTVFGYFNWYHLVGDANRARLLQAYVYQSIGIGVAVTRDVYLYPNVQFLPGEMRAKDTNVALNATLNVF